MRRTLQRRLSSLKGGTELGPLVVENGCSSLLPAAVQASGKMCVFVVGDTAAAEERAGRSLFELRKNGLLPSTFVAQGLSPTCSNVDEGVALARRVGASSVVAVGSGAVIDTAKAIAALFASSTSSKSHLMTPEAGLVKGGLPIGSAEQVIKGGLPCHVVPTTAGTGCAVTSLALINHPEEDMLCPLKSSDGKALAYTLPEHVLVDPVLCKSLPLDMTKAMALTSLGGCLDALVAVHKGQVCNDDDDIDMLAREGLELVREGMYLVQQERSNSRGRHALSAAAVLAGTLASRRQGLQLRMMALAAAAALPHIPYTQLYASLLPHSMEVFISALEKYEDGGGVRDLFRESLDWIEEEVGGAEDFAELVGDELAPDALSSTADMFMALEDRYATESCSTKRRTTSRPKPVCSSNQ
ncbi:unnamed protein product [Chrysoparadoxa australica]